MTGPDPTASPRPSDGQAERRRAQVRSLSLLDVRVAPIAGQLLAMVRSATDAAAVALSVVTDDSAVSVAGSMGRMEVELEASPAARAVLDVGHRLEVTVRAGEPLADHPWIAPRLETIADQDGDVEAASVTVVVVPLATPGGPAVAALELYFADERHPDAAALGLADLAADHLGKVLELHAEADEYRRFVELAPDPIALLDAEGRIERVNPAFARTLRVPSYRLTGRSFLELIARDQRTRATAQLSRLLVSPLRTVQLELSLCADDDTVVPCMVSAAHLGGARRHLMVVAHDLSDRLRTEHEQSRLSEQLARAQRLDSVGQVAGGLAHDLNNLLMVMVANLGMAEESLADVRAQTPDALEQLSTDLAELRTAIERANELTSTLLDFGSRRGGREEIAHVLDAVGSVEALVARSLPEGVSLQVTTPDVVPPVSADPVELERAVLNLVINARDALGPAGGTVEVAVRPMAPEDQPGRRRADDARLREAVRIEVRDDGIGMDAGTQARAFEPLFTTKGEDGTGLGLAMVASFVDEVEGTVQVESAPGEGTCVAMHVPVARTAAADVPVGVDVPVAGARVVLVDPGERTRRDIARMLRSSGYRVRPVATAAEAREAVAAEDVSLVVTELALPDGGGVRLVASFRARHPGLAAVVLASIGGPRTLDGVPVLVKPFSHTRLLKTVERVLAER